MSGLDPHGVDVLATEDRRTLVGPRTKRVLGAVLVVALAAGWLVDRDIRESERRALDRCSMVADEAVTLADARLNSMVAYVRATLFRPPNAEVRDALHRMLERTAAEAIPRLNRAHELCGSVEVLALHGQLRDRRDACLGLLQLTRSYFEAVVEEGRAVFKDMPERSPRRTACAGGAGQ